MQQESNQWVGSTNVDGEPSTPVVLWFGVAVVVIGCVIMTYAGLFYDPSVESTSSSEFGLSSRINNTGLLQHQLMLFELGGYSLVSGTVLFVSGLLLDLIQRLGNRTAVGDKLSSLPLQSETKSNMNLEEAQ